MPIRYQAAVKCAPNARQISLDWKWHRKEIRMKIKIKLPNEGKPRNPLALAARQRNAGVHEPENRLRTERRKEKQRLRETLARRLKDGSE